MTYPVGRLAKKFGLSRSTLLYYDSIGLLCPEVREEGAYRRYGEREVKRLSLVCLYREAGLSLKEIKRVLEAKDSELAGALEQRLENLNEEIAQLHAQRGLVLRLLKNKPGLARTGPLTKELWTAMMADAGFTEEDMRPWHRTFERRSPEEHQRLLEFLQITDKEIGVIRAWSRESGDVFPGF